MTKNQPNTIAKTLAACSYLTPLGLLICFFLNKDQKSKFASWHIKNMFGLCLLYFIAYMFSFHEGLFIPGAIFLYSSMFFWLVSLLMAFLGKEMSIPWLSQQFQKWFRFLD